MERLSHDPISRRDALHTAAKAAAGGAVGVWTAPAILSLAVQDFAQAGSPNPQTPRPPQNGTGGNPGGDNVNNPGTPDQPGLPGQPGGPGQSGPPGGPSPGGPGDTPGPIGTPPGPITPPPGGTSPTPPVVEPTVLPTTVPNPGPTKTPGPKKTPGPQETILPRRITEPPGGGSSGPLSAGRQPNPLGGAITAVTGWDPRKSAVIGGLLVAGGVALLHGASDASDDPLEEQAD